MSPIIGVTCQTSFTTPESVGDRNYEIHQVSASYVRAVENAGGAPVLLPLLERKESALNLLPALDGLLLTGGPDIDPALYGEEPKPLLSKLDVDKDRLEMWLAKAAIDRELPTFGICRGMQLLNVAMGGSLYQDVSLFSSDVLKHYQAAPGHHATHDILVERGARLFDIFGAQKVRVNSYHHQAIRDVAPDLRVTARAQDGIIEAVEHLDGRFLLGVQFHPEGMWAHHPEIVALFSAFVKAARP